ncbi:MAG: hypothetical protein K9N49_09350, partial [Candidatus Marinimicrobia bacterium]|nr:hypothetical protein [Candidatus Neomarinimicrobiota bacterium]
MTAPAPAIQRARHRLHIAADLFCETGTAVTAGIPADNFLRGAFRRHRNWGAKDRRFYGDTVFAYLRWRGWLDPLGLDGPTLGVLARQLDGLPTEAAAGLEAPLLPLDAANPDPAALRRRAVWLAARTGHPEPALGELYPPAVRDLFTSHCPPGLEPALLLAIGQCRPPLWLRLADSVKDVQLRALDLRRDARLSHAASAAKPLSEHQIQDVLGPATVIQDIASQAVGLIARPLPGQTWWDACAGGGGKSLHLAALMGNRGRVWATDCRETALRECGRRAAKAGYETIACRPLDAAVDPPPDPDCDGVLLDAPCSGLGTWGRNPDARWRFQASQLADVVERQRALLDQTARAVKPGGVLIYAVCAWTRAETSDLIRAWLTTRPAFRLQPFTHPLTGLPTTGQILISAPEGPGNTMYIAR